MLRGYSCLFYVIYYVNNDFFFPSEEDLFELSTKLAPLQSCLHHSVKTVDSMVVLSKF